MSTPALEQALHLLAQEKGLRVLKRTRALWAQHLSLVREWHERASLVSEGDLIHLEARHLVDALSLAPYVLQVAGPQGSLLDIGSGGGFPAIPLKCLLPRLRVTLIERNARKVGFLRRLLAEPELQDVLLLHGSFPEVPDKLAATVITARAIDHAPRALRAILQRIPPETVFLCQSPLPVSLPREMFHVEHIDDAWRRSGLRRGELHLIRRSLVGR